MASDDREFPHVLHCTIWFRLAVLLALGAPNMVGAFAHGGTGDFAFGLILGQGAASDLTLAHTF